MVEFQELQPARFSITCTAQHLRSHELPYLTCLLDFSYLQVVIPADGGSYGAGLSADTLPMHGLGYGLPLSRLYARYFRQIRFLSLALKLFTDSRGDIKIASVDGYGTDVYVYLQRLSHLAQENLPVYNAVSSAKLRNSATQVNDWTHLGSSQ